MTNKTSGLKALGEKLRAGLNSVNEQAKARAENRPPKEDENASLVDQDDESMQAKHSPDERISALDEGDLEDGIIIEGDAQPEKPKRKGLDKKQKILLFAALAIAGVWVMKNKDSAPFSIPSAQTEATQSAQPRSDNAADAPAFDFGKEPEPDAPIEISTAGGENSLEFGAGEPPAHDPANSPMGSEAVTADLNEQFGSPPLETTQVLDPFSGEVTTTDATPADLATKPTAIAPSPAPQQPAKADHLADATSELAMLGADSGSPFSGGGSNSTELSGTKSQNPDSKDGVLQDQGAKADVADLKAKVAEKDGRIGTLETQVSKLKTDLAAANAKLNALQTHPGQQKAAASKTPPKKATQPTQTAQRSPSTQRAATAPKAVARPQICVTAVAQAARNCTTCVPHAFITHRRIETMVGQGDFIEGLRVNIVGDRLDLQNAQGVVVHKFWSSPNGCAAG